MYLTITPTILVHTPFCTAIPTSSQNIAVTNATIMGFIIPHALRTLGMINSIATYTSVYNLYTACAIIRCYFCYNYSSSISSKQHAYYFQCYRCYQHTLLFLSNDIIWWKCHQVASMPFCYSPVLMIWSKQHTIITREEIKWQNSMLLSQERK